MIDEIRHYLETVELFTEEGHAPKFRSESDEITHTHVEFSHPKHGKIKFSDAAIPNEEGAATFRKMGYAKTREWTS